MTKAINKTTRNGHIYPQLMYEKVFNVNQLKNYIACLGKYSTPKNEIDPEEILQYIQRLLKKGTN